MGVSLEFILKRAEATKSAQERVKDQWVWEEMTVQDWQTRIENFQAQEKKTQHAETRMLAVRGAFDATLADLHARTVQGVRMARVRYRNDAASLAIVDRLSANGQERQEILDQALEWSSAWAQLDPGWAPVNGNTLEAFNALRETGLTQQQAYIEAYTAWRAEAETLNAQADALDERNVNWYQAATAVFLEGTAEGDMIRQTVPTTYNPDTTSVTPPESGTTPT